MSDKKKTFDVSCLCGAVRFRTVGPLGKMGHCHCVDCRKAHGAAFVTFVDVPRKQFSILQGEEKLKRHRAESGAVRSFCVDCGAILLWELDRDPGSVSIPAATFDTPPDRQPEYHFFMRSRVPWLEINDGLPQFAAYPDRQG